MKYTVSAVVTISIYTTVEADSEKEALRIAEERGEIEHNEWGEDWKQNEMWIADEYDGMPVELKIDN